MEHWVLAALMEVRVGLNSWKTYELERVNPPDFQTTDLRFIVLLHKGISYLRNDWFYLAEQNFTQTIMELEKPDITLQPDSKAFFALAAASDISLEEQFRYQMLGATHLLRGFARYQTGHSTIKEKAVQDIELAVNNYSKAGIDNEFVWLAESFVYIKHEKTEKAIDSLNKLEKSPLFGQREKQLLADAKRKIKERNPDSALGFVTDKIIIYKLGMNYAESYIAEIEWMTLLEETQAGKRILTKFMELEQTYEKAKEYLNLNKLRKGSEYIIKELSN